MIKILELILGTTDYYSVIAGFIVAFVVAAYKAIKEWNITLKESLLHVLAIIIFMRFYPFLANTIGFEIGMENSMIAALISGFFSRKILDKFHEEITEHIDEL